MPPRATRSAGPRGLATALAVVVAAALLAACGSSRTGPVDGRTPGGYRTVSEHIGPDRFSLAVPRSWRSATTTHGNARLVLFSPGGVAATNASALEKQGGLVLVGWTPNTSASVETEISETESAAAGLKDLSSRVTRIYLPGTADSKLLDQSYTSAAGRPGNSSTLVVATNHGGLIDIEAIQSARTAGFSPTDATDAFSFTR